MATIQPIVPCLWFDDQAEEAAKYYVSIFTNSRITNISRYGEEGREIHGRPAGSVMVVGFELNGQAFTALNGGPIFTFNEAISFQVMCDTQEEIDYYWDRLKEGGPVDSQQCGWVKDKFGLSWQVVPRILEKLASDPKDPRSQRAFAAMMGMKKIEIAGLQRAYDGE